MDTDLTRSKPMGFFYDSSRELAIELYQSYSTNSKSLIGNIKRDKNLSQFDTFNKRFEISWGMKIEFTDELPITREETRACYVLMLKVSDIWFAFEHLIQTASKVIPKDANPKSKINMYRDRTLKELGFDSITLNFNRLLRNHILDKASSHEEMYSLLDFLKNKTRFETKDIILESMHITEEKKEFHPRHILAVAYGLRNVYVHKGVAAAMGSSNYKLKRSFYSIVYDTLILYSLALGKAYCQKCLASFECK